jgi:L-lactate dehydrogenase (cytochrome)
LRKSIYFRDDS